MVNEVFDIMAHTVQKPACMRVYSHNKNCILKIDILSTINGSNINILTASRQRH